MVLVSWRTGNSWFGFGIAVFERLQGDEFNPNVSLEVGYMFALRKDVCLLKDETLKGLHTDLVGKLYRPFDPQDAEATIADQLERWLADKGIPSKKPTGKGAPPRAGKPGTANDGPGFSIELPKDLRDTRTSKGQGTETLCYYAELPVGITTTAKATVLKQLTVDFRLDGQHLGTVIGERYSTQHRKYQSLPLRLKQDDHLLVTLHLEILPSLWQKLNAAKNGFMVGVVAVDHREATADASEVLRISQ